MNNVLVVTEILVGLAQAMQQYTQMANDAIASGVDISNAQLDQMSAQYQTLSTAHQAAIAKAKAAGK